MCWLGGVMFVWEGGEQESFEEPTLVLDVFRIAFLLFSTKDKRDRVFKGQETIHGHICRAKQMWHIHTTCGWK